MVFKKSDPPCLKFLFLGKDPLFLQMYGQKLIEKNELFIIGKKMDKSNITSRKKLLNSM
jgi:hypothetical protein